MVALTLSKYLEELRSLPAEKALEPNLKHDQQKQDVRIREEQDLTAGAVLQAVVQPGEGDACPGPGDLVYVHVTIRREQEDADVVYSTQSQYSGNGQPLAFLIEKGKRAPRAWEIVLKGMTKKQVCVLKVKPSYGYQHPDCSMEAPASVPVSEPLSFELALVEWYPADKVRALPLGDGIYRRLLKDGTGWESPRPPFEVTFHCKAMCPAYDGVQLTGFRYFSSFTDKPLTALMGSGQLPPALETALTSMTEGERSVFVVPAEQMKPSAAGRELAEGERRPCLLPAPPSTAAQVEVELELLGLVQVRDMTGDGSVVKRRLKQGHGQFPIDCPLEDTTVCVHYRVRRLEVSSPQQLLQSASGGDGAWAYDTRTRQVEGEAGSSAQGPPPVELDTGCGDMPDALEMCIKLMVPGEVARVAAHSRHAYEGRSDCPPGISPSDAVEFEVELERFEREGHWQNLSFEQRYAVSEKMKAKGNTLFRAKKYKYARSRYERLLRLLDSTRDFETQEHVQKIEEYKLMVVSNLALCCTNQEDYVQAVAYASKGLEHAPESAKLLIRRARALSLKGSYDEAEEDLKTLQGLVGSNPEAAELSQEVEQELQANKRRAKAAEAKQKRTFANFFERADRAA